MTCDANRVTATAWAPPTERLAQVRAFMAERVLPNEAAIGRQDAAGERLLEQLQSEVRDAGLWAPHVPPEIGVQVIEEIARKGIPEVWLNPGADSDALIARARALQIQPIVACSIVAIGQDPYAF